MPPQRNVENATPTKGHACILCRRNKRKCDGSKPACSYCTKSGRSSECKYEFVVTATTTGNKAKSPKSPSDPSSSTSGTVANKASAGPRNDNKVFVPSRSSSPAIPTEVLLLDHSVDWWKAEELPDTIKDFLVTTFVKHSAQVHLDPLVPSILSRLHRYPPSHPLYPHSSLLNAMYLIAIFYLSSSRHPTRVRHRIKWNAFEVEMTFLSKTRKAMARNLSLVENLLDYLLSSNILSKYLYGNMRQIEAHHESTGAVQFAMACNLHTISSVDAIASFSNSLLAYPTNAQEVYERINAFWSLFIMDRGGSVCVGLDCAIPDEKITTAFPSPVPYLTITGRLTPQFHTVTSVYDPNSAALDVSSDSRHIMMAKLTAILEKVRQMLVEAIQQEISVLEDAPPSYQTRFHQTEQVVNKLISYLPPIFNVPIYADTTGTFGNVTAEIGSLHGASRATLIQLHLPFAFSGSKEGLRSRELSLQAASEIVAVTRIMEKTNEVYWYVCMYKAWDNACGMYQQEILRILKAGIPPNSKGEKEKGTVKALRADLDYMVLMLRRFVNVYPSYHVFVATIEEMIAEDTTAIEQFLRTNDSSSLQRTAEKNSQAVPIRFVHWSAA